MVQIFAPINVNVNVVGCGWWFRFTPKIQTQKMLGAHPIPSPKVEFHISNRFPNFEIALSVFL
jgi:hypothetical protein